MMLPEFRAFSLMALCFLAVGCADGPAEPPLDPTIQAAKPSSTGGGGGGNSLVADVSRGDGVFVESDSVIVSTCPGAVGNQWHVNFEHTGCLIVRPNWTSANHAPYTLTDDVILVVTKENGKNGRITQVKLNGQDVIGDGGIFHSTDAVAVAQPVVPDKNGFVLHVHAREIEVWRHDGHTGGARVEVIGTIAIGDIVYRSQ